MEILLYHLKNSSTRHFGFVKLRYRKRVECQVVGKEDEAILGFWVAAGDVTKQVGIIL